MYQVFTDFHHASLLNSLIMLFEGRLEGQVYRPVGVDWYNLGFWNIYDHPATREQFLGLNQSFTPIDGTPPLNRITEAHNEIYSCYDIDSDKTNKAITFNAFKELPIDIVIASVPQHIEPFTRLINEYKPKAKLIYQIGNTWNIQGTLVKNVMASALINNAPPDINLVEYHQEFDLNTFNPKPINNSKNIFSFVNCFNIDGLFTEDWQLFQDLENQMPDWTFKSYGGQCRDGAAHGSKELAEYINQSRFIWHTKRGGDGYGHIIHNVASCGKPMIVRKDYYLGKLGEALMLDGETCIDITELSLTGIRNKIEFYNRPDNYAKMVQKIIDNFKEKVNFDEEEIAIKEFLEKLR